MVNQQPKRRKPGRPFEGGRDPLVGVRLPEEQIQRIDALAASEQLSRSEAIRRLVELGLTAGTAKRPKK